MSRPPNVTLYVSTLLAGRYCTFFPKSVALFFGAALYSSYCCGRGGGRRRPKKIVPWGGGRVGPCPVGPATVLFFLLLEIWWETSTIKNGSAGGGQVEFTLVGAAYFLAAWEMWEI